MLTIRKVIIMFLFFSLLIRSPSSPVSIQSFQTSFHIEYPGFPVSPHAIESGQYREITFSSHN